MFRKGYKGKRPEIYTPLECIARLYISILVELINLTEWNNEFALSYCIRDVMYVMVAFLCIFNILNVHRAAAKRT